MPVQEASNNFVITGIPRSGTSLLCNLVNRVKNIVCLNEVPMMYDVDNLSAHFHDLRHALKSKHPVPMMLSKETGKEITDTQTQDRFIRSVVIDIDENRKLAVGSKINVPYLFQMQKIISYRFGVFSVIRNPIYAIASWNQHAEKINEGHVLDSEFEQWPRYKEFKFQTQEKFTRQAELYNHFVQIILHYDLTIIHYEDLVKHPKEAVQGLAEFLDMPFDLKEEIGELENLNRDSRFPEIDLDEIRDAVKKYCPTMKGGYA